MRTISTLEELKKFGDGHIFKDGGINLYVNNGELLMVSAFNFALLLFLKDSVILYIDRRYTVWITGNVEFALIID